MILSIFVLICFSILKVNGRGTGSGTCFAEGDKISMSRTKNVDFVTDYHVQPDNGATTYTPGGAAMPIKIDHTDRPNGDKVGHCGILVYVVDSNGNRQGSWQVTGTTKHCDAQDCNGLPTEATITHSERYGSPIETILQWVPPATNVGDLTFQSVILSGERGTQAGQAFYFPTPFTLKPTGSPATTTTIITTTTTTAVTTTAATTACDQRAGTLCYHSLSLPAQHSRDDALAACQAWQPGAVLPHVLDDTQNAAVKATCGSSWLGVQRQAVDSTTWVFTDTPTTTTSYLPWSPGEPNNYKFASGATEDCVSFANRAEPMWNDRPCVFESQNPGHPECVACQIDMSALPTSQPGTTPTNTPSTTGSTKDATGAPEGCPGCKCRPNNICESGLTCEKNVCTAQCNVGTGGCTCRSDGSCDAGFKCEEAKCVADCVLGTLNCPCGSGSQCDAGLQCALYGMAGYCLQSGGGSSCTPGSQGCACRTDKSCDGTLQCQTGAADERCLDVSSCPQGESGCSCLADGSCQPPAVCNLMGYCLLPASTGCRDCPCNSDLSCDLKGLTCVTVGTGSFCAVVDIDKLPASTAIQHTFTWSLLALLALSL